MFSRLIPTYSTCPECGEQTDSLDVVCSTDSAVLSGANYSKSTQTNILRLIRVAFVAMAFALGYLKWTWPVYLFGYFITLAFFTLFVRNHSATRNYLITMGVLISLSMGIWYFYLQSRVEIKLEFFLLHIAHLILIVSLIFTIAYTLRTRSSDFRQAWRVKMQLDNDISNGLLTWIAFVFSLGFLLILMLFFYKYFPRFDLVQEYLPMENMTVQLIRASFYSFATGLVSIMISSTIYSLRGNSFRVLDRWNYRPLLSEKKFRRVNGGGVITIQNWTDRISATVQRVVTSSSNRIIAAIEGSYNLLFVGSVNNLARITIRIANTVRRGMIKIALHIGRSLGRFSRILQWGILWAIHVLRHYWRSFILPIITLFLLAWASFQISQLAYSYIHDGSWNLPFNMLFIAIVVFIALSLSISLLMKTNILSFGEKILDAFAVFGTSAFLFFVLSGWVLGIIGIVMNGPYRIGWVTLTSTAFVIVIFLIAQRKADSTRTDSPNTN